MGEKLKKLLNSKLFSLICLAIIITIMLCAYFFRQDLETYLAWGVLGLLVGCFLSNATILLPAPSLLLVCQFSQILGPLATATIASIGSSLGELVGFFAGYSGKKLLPEKQPGKIVAVLKKHPYSIIFVFSLIPWPLFDVVGLISGALQINWKRFYLACLFGKFLKMLAIGLAFTCLASHYPDILNRVSWSQIKAILFR